MLSDNVRAELAAALAQAERSRVAMSPMTDTYADIDVVDAYEIQLLSGSRKVPAWWDTRLACPARPCRK